MVRQVLSATGMSLNEYVVSCAVAAAADDLADRLALAGPRARRDELQDLLNQPPVAKPEIARLLAQPSLLEQE